MATGAAWLSPAVVTAHAEETVELVYVVGEGGLHEGDALRIEDPVLHGMRLAKWARLTTDPTECGPAVLEGASGALVTAWTTGQADVVVERSTLSTAIHAYATTDVWLEDGALVAGDEVHVVFGDTAQGGPDCAMQTSPRAFHHVPWRVWEHRAADGSLARVSPSPTLTILARQEPAEVRAVLPSQAQVDAPVALTVAVLDVFGNAVEDYEGTVTVAGQQRRITALDGGVQRWLLTLDEGVHRVDVDVDGLAARSNPVRVTAAAPALSVYWGDIHTHHGHTIELPDGTWFDENTLYARDVAALDVACESTKLRPVEIDGGGVWRDLQRSCEELTEDGRFVSLLGFEWLGGEHGHHNVYYDACDGELGSREIVGLATEGGLWDWLDAQQQRLGVDAVAVPHATLYTGHDWRRSRRQAPEWDARFRTAIEVQSHWGSSMAPAEEEGSVQSGLAAGVRAGFIASSDSHHGWSGNPLYREKSALPGLAAFLAPTLSRQDIFEALQQRRTYATTGPRILLDYEAVVDGAAVLPGEVAAPVQPPRFRWEVHGTEAITRLRLVAVAVGGRVEERVLHEEAPGTLDAAGEVQPDALPGGEVAVWLEVEQEDGHQAWASPVYLEPAGCGCTAGSGGGGLGLVALVGLLRRRRRPCYAQPPSGSGAPP